MLVDLSCKPLSSAAKSTLRLLNCLKRGKQGGKPQPTIMGLAVLAKSGHRKLLIGSVVGFESLWGFDKSARKMHESFTL